MLNTSAAYILLWRNRHIHALAIGCALIIVCSLMASQFSGRTPATVAMDVGISLYRLFMPIMIMLILHELLYKEIEQRSYLISLTYPKTRTAFLLNRIKAVSLTVVLTTLFFYLLLTLLVQFVNSSYAQATAPSDGLLLFLTFAFMLLDFIIVMLFTLLMIIISKSSSFHLIASIGFVIISRTFGPVIELLSRQDQTIWSHGTDVKYQNALSILYFILPDLSSLDIRMIALYDKIQLLGEGWGITLTSNIAYSLALLGIAVWVFNKKQFD
jgi:ABC-type transport system involved in multi-copper enzyme maturation permease subunit